MKLLNGRTAIVTGGTQGIGRAIAERFCAAGASVMTCGLEAERGHETVESILEAHPGANIAYQQTDLEDPEAAPALVHTTLDRFGPPAVVVNNAAAIDLLHVLGASVESFDRAMAVNVRAAWLLVRAAHPSLKTDPSAAIVNIASTHPYQTRAESFPYNASKGALLSMSKAMALDLGADGIRVNSILPGFIDTPSTRTWVARQPDPEEKWTEIVASHPLGRPPDADEVAAVAVFLASDLSSGVSGAEILVDCGRQTMRSGG